MKSTNMPERFKRGAEAAHAGVRVFPNEASCLPLMRALGVDQHELWQQDNRYLNMELLKEARRQRLKATA